MDNKLKITSGYNFEGYNIVEYLGHYTGEYVLGTGFLSSLDASIADFIGSGSGLYKDKLQNAKRWAMESLTEKVGHTKANAIIGIDLGYTMFSNNMIGVIVSGTAVCIEPVKADESAVEVFHYNVSNYYPEFWFRPYAINCMKKNNGEALLQIEIMNYSNRPIDAVNVDIDLGTIFDDHLPLGDISFTDIHQIKSPSKKFQTEYVEVPIKSGLFKIIDRVYININKYISNGQLFRMTGKPIEVPLSKEQHNKLIDRYGDDVVCELNETDVEWICVCGTHNDIQSDICKICGREKEGKSLNQREILNNILKRAYDCATAREIYDMLTENLQDLHILPQSLMQTMKDNVQYEKLYGNMKDSSVTALKKYIEE